jgi:Fur family ferric uptake transcriptional regulator
VGPAGREKTAENPQRQWREFVSEKRLHASKTRELVVDIFLKTKEHIDLQSLFERTRRAQPGVGFATVYRTMKLLEEAGIAHTRRFGNTKETLYEVAVGKSHHDHLICEQCGRIVEFVSPEVERIQDRIANRHGFTLSRHRHELYGVCADCRAGRKAAT